MAKQTRAEAYAANKPLRQEGFRICKPRLPFAPLITMLDVPDGEWHVDAPLDEIALKGGFIDKSFDRRKLRENLCVVGVMAYAEAEVNLNVIKWAEEQRRKSMIVDDFLKLIDGLESEIHAVDHALGKHPEIDGHQYFESLQNFLELGEAIRPLAKEYINDVDLPDGTVKADATKHDEREFFKAITEWWLANVVSGWRGEASVKNRLAGALWLDFGRAIPLVKSKHDGKPIEQCPQDWAKEQFKLLRNKSE